MTIKQRGCISDGARRYPDWKSLLASGTMEKRQTDLHRRLCVPVLGYLRKVTSGACRAEATVTKTVVGNA